MIPYVREGFVLTGLIVVAICCALSFNLGGVKARAELAEYRADMAERTAKVAGLSVIAAEAAKRAARDHVEALALIATKYEKEREDAAADAYERALDDVRAGRYRLRDEWRDTCATAGVSTAAAAAGSGDEAAERRGRAAARIIRIGAEADAQLRACQAVISEDRVVRN